MKKGLTLIIFLFSITLVGCANNQENQPQENNTSTNVAQEKDDKDEVLNNESAKDDTASNETETISEEDASSEAGEQEKTIAPDFTVKNLNGDEVSLSDLKGKTIFLNFWATWCTWCKKEMPDMQKVHEAYKDEDVVIIALNVGESKEKVEEWIKKEKFDFGFDVWLDEDSSVQRAYYVSAFPTTFIIDKEGYALGYVPGAMTEEDMKKIIDDAIKLQEK